MNKRLICGNRTKIYSYLNPIETNEAKLFVFSFHYMQWGLQTTPPSQHPRLLKIHPLSLSSIYRAMELPGFEKKKKYLKLQSLHFIVVLNYEDFCSHNLETGIIWRPKSSQRR